LPYAILREISSCRLHFSSRDPEFARYFVYFHLPCYCYSSGTESERDIQYSSFLHVYACIIGSFARAIYTGNALLPTLFPSINWSSIPAYVLQYVLSANLRCSWQPLIILCDKACVTVSMSFQTGKNYKSTRWMEERFHKRQTICRIFYVFPLRLELIHRYFFSFFLQFAQRIHFFKSKPTSKSSHTAFCTLAQIQFIGPKVQQEYQISVSRCKM
jgi:hypothetical protein